MAEYQRDSNSLLEGTKNERSEVTTHSRLVPNPSDPIFIFGKSLTPNKENLYRYFPVLVGRSSKSLYMLLAIVFANPLRSERWLIAAMQSNSQTTAKNVRILLDMGYVQAEKKPRKIIPFDAYTIDRVYRITRKGVKALSAITGY